jgi:hypothetical protein
MNFMDSEERGEYETVTEILNVYSGDRNTANYSNPNHYTINLLEKVGKTFRNVKCVRLLSGIFPDQGAIGTEPYLILKVPQFNSGMTGTNTNLQEGSCIIQIDRAVTTGNFFNLKTDISKCIFNTYQNPISEISKLSIDIVDVAGEPFSFGSDTLIPTKSLQHLLVFEFVMEVKKNKIMSKIINTF